MRGFAGSPERAGGVARSRREGERYRTGAGSGGRRHKRSPFFHGSPAINAVTKTLGLTTDQHCAGFASVVDGAIDIGPFESNPPPQVREVNVSEGSAERSRITSVTVAFDALVTVYGAPVSAFSLKRQSDNAATIVLAVGANGATTSVTLTFLASPAVDFRSLPLGRYPLTIDQSKGH